MDLELQYTDVEKQIQKLKSQGLIINNDAYATNALKLYGYSNIIKSYREPYIFRNGDTISYRPNITFEHICSLYLLDKNLRNAVMATMQDLEELIKEAAANAVGSSFGIHQDQYLQYRNYRNKEKHKHRFRLGAILDTMKSALNTDKEPIHHYMEKYGYVPPWILFKSVYFSTIVNFIDLFKKEELEKMTAQLFDSEYLNISKENLCCLLTDTLFICIDYRNKAAHGGRIYNYNSPNRFRVNEIFGITDDLNINGLSKLLLVLSTFNYTTPYDNLRMALQRELDRHCNSYPEDIPYLSHILNININREEVVWITKNSAKYHSAEHCSGIKNARKIRIDDAKSHGYVPCKRCCD